MLRNDNWVAEGIELVFRLGIATGAFRMLVWSYRNGRMSTGERDLLERKISMAYAIDRKHPDLARFDNPVVHTGELPLGTLANGNPFHLKLSQLALSILLVGATNSGKTTLIRGLCVALFRHLNSVGKGGVWLVDHMKTELETVIPLADDFGLRTAIVTRDLPINPLEPPMGVPPMTWMVHVLKTLEFALSLSEIAVLNLRPLLHNLYLKDPCPTWQDLIKAVTAAEMLEAVRRPVLLRLQGIASDLPGVALTKNGVAVQEFENRVVYFPLYSWPQDHARLLYGTLSWAVFARRREERFACTEPNLIKIEDEIGFAYPSNSGNEFISMLCAVQRSLGIAFVGAVQNFDVLPQLRANCNTMICGRLGDMKDINEACASLTLTSSDQRESFTRELCSGHFITRLPSGHLSPFPFTALNVPGRPLTADARKNAEESLFRELNLRRPERARSASSEGAPTHAQEVTKSTSAAPPAAFHPMSRALSPDEELLLRSCHSQRFLNHSERADICGLNPNRFSRTKKALIDQLLVKELALESLKPGNRMRLLEIAPLGCRRLDLPEPGWGGRNGGYLSHYGLHVASSYFRHRGYRVELEKPLGSGLAADLVATSTKDSIAVEVQCTIDHAKENLAKLVGRVDRVEFLCFSVPVLRQLTDLFPKEERVRVLHYSRYLDLGNAAEGPDASRFPSKKGG